jgi:hypothetical protein
MKAHAHKSERAQNWLPILKSNPATVTPMPVAPPKQDPAASRFRDGFEPAKGSPDSTAQFEYNLRGTKDDALKQLASFFEARIKDAKSGPVQDPAAVSRAEEKLALVNKEIATRKSLGGTVAGKDHKLDNAALQKEIAKQQEILKESTTGLARDPKAAAAARKAIAAGEKEMQARSAEAASQASFTKLTTFKPITPDEISKMTVDARKQPTASLQSELKRLTAVDQDATKGAFQNKTVAQNAEAKIKVIKAELDARAQIAKRPDAGFAKEIHTLSDSALTGAQATWQQVLNDATKGVAKDPKLATTAREHLKSIGDELARRTSTDMHGGPVGRKAGTPAQEPPPVTPAAAGGTDPSAADPSATDPSATDPSATDPSATDPSATDPSLDDPSLNDPSLTDPSAMDPSLMDPSLMDASMDVSADAG